MTEDGCLPRLLLVVASPQRKVRVEAALVMLAGAAEVRSPVAGAFVVHVAKSSSELRDALREAVGIDTLFIVEFERWSALGNLVDSTWLLRRGH